MMNEIIYRPLTDEDKLILETIRKQNHQGIAHIPLSQWRSVLKTNSNTYVREVLNIHCTELNTVQLVSKGNYRLTLHGVFLLDGIYLMLAKVFKKTPCAV